MKITDGEGACSVCDRTEGPLLLSWTDPKSGEELTVEMWGPPEFAHELAELGFEVREASWDDETASSLRVVIRQPNAGENLW